MTEKLIQGLQRFQSGYYQKNKATFEALADSQAPRVLFITCSDSRVDPNLITQSGVGEIFVIRNAGNIMPPFGAANGGEGAALEYALGALDIREIVVCGHTNCGAMKGLFKMDKLQTKMPLVYDWLLHTEATRRVLKENYSSCSTEDQLDIAVAENVLTQLENLRTYPIVRSKLHRHELVLHGWIYDIEGGKVLAYDVNRHEFVPPSQVTPAPESAYNLHAACKRPEPAPIPSISPTPQPTPGVASNLPGRARLSSAQADRIFRGSHR
ncbi:MAG: carbonic anhydrase [Cyanobacteria bacterium P01_A01_bin.3]